MHLAALGIHASFVEATQQCGNNDLLVAVGDYVQLQNGALARLENLIQVQMMIVIEDEVVFLQAAGNLPAQRADRAGVLGLVLGVFLANLNHSALQVFGGPVLAFAGARDPGIRSAQEIMLFFGEVRKQVTEIAEHERGDAYLDLIVTIDLDFGLIRAAPAACAKLWPVCNLVERAVFAVWVNNQHAGFVIGPHQFFDDDAGKVAFAGAGAGDDCQVRADHFSDIKDDRYRAICSGEQGANPCRADGLRLALAEDTGEQRVIRQINGAARGWGNPGVDEAAQRFIVIAHDGNVQFKKFVGGIIIANQRGYLAGWDLWLGQEGIGIELHRHPLQNAPQYLAWSAGDDRLGAAKGKSVVDVLAVF